jgi:plastocyanin
VHELDPEQIYTEVLQEEQQKGTSPAVAEGRAKAARLRATHGSPHPTEPKWWPGSQPQFEEGGAEAVAEEPAEEEAPAPEEAPAAEAEQPAPAAEAEQPAPAAEAEQPAPAAEAAPAPAAEAEQPAPAAEAAPAPAAAAAEQQPAAVSTAPRPIDLPPEDRPSGVSHGLPAGTRLRPEDAVAAEAQFDGQQAVAMRRKVIDDLIDTGVPAVTAASTGDERSPWISLVFLLIPILAVGFLVANRKDLGASEAPPPGQTEGGGPSGPNSIVAEDSQFDKDELTFKAGEETQFDFVNRDAIQHDLAIYPTQADAEAQSNDLFTGEPVTDSTATYKIPAMKKGNYVFQCNFHPTSMTGTVTVE